MKFPYMSEAPLSFSHAEKVALLVVDIQKIYYSKNMVIKTNFPNIPANVKKLLKACRHLGLEVIHIRANY